MKVIMRKLLWKKKARFSIKIPLIQVKNNNIQNPYFLLDYIQNAKRWNDLIETNSEKLNTHFLNYVGSLKVNTVASEHIVTSSEKIPDYKIKEIKVPTLKANDTISVQDLQMVLRGVFYEDSGYVLVDKPTAAEDFFATVNSYKTFLKSIEKYYKEVKKESKFFKFSFFF